MPKNRIIFRKNCKNPETLGLRPHTPIGFRRLGLHPKPRVIFLICYCNFEIKVNAGPALRRAKGALTSESWPPYF